MKPNRRILAIGARRSEEGMALITVLLVAVVLSIVAVSSVQFATGSQELSRRDQDWNAALSAAEGGIDDYLLHLNQDGNYFNYSATNAPPIPNDAFTTMADLPGPANKAKFTYTPDASTIAVDGAVKIKVTGQVGGVTRTVNATLRRRNFLDYVYFTDYETRDPAFYVPDPFAPGSNAQTECARHRFDSPPRNPACTTIVFTTGDEIRGPLHSNDAIRMNGTPRFLGPTSTSWNPPAIPPATQPQRWWTTSSATPSFVSSGDPAFLEALNLPPSNAGVKTFTDAALGYNGCLYTGPTRIKFNSDGTMTVRSPFTKAGNCTPLGTTSAVTLPIPTDGVIYVQNIPSTTTDPNYSTCSSYPANIVPVAADEPNYACKNGDVFVSGTLKGQVTVASANNIIVWNDLTYNTAPPGGTDVLGLVADNYVEVYHPVLDRCPAVTNPNSACPGSPPNPNPRWLNVAIPGGPPTKIDGAILSVLHSFRVQNYARGAIVGNLTVRGAIAQRYRGIVGTVGTSGYLKDYNYDNRLKYIAPPHFIDPIQSAWQVKTFAELKGGS